MNAILRGLSPQKIASIGKRRLKPEHLRIISALRSGSRLFYFHKSEKFVNTLFLRRPACYLCETEDERCEENRIALKVFNLLKFLELIERVETRVAFERWELTKSVSIDWDKAWEKFND